ncbi:MAG: hypothetical protein KFF49_04525 [Bacteroidales bacterium]|nr:hypothetical protein [Bacteroidales bacterium]
MKKIILVSIILFTTLMSYGQLVRPNRPHVILDGRKGYITINEFAAGSGLSGQSTPYSEYYFGITTLHAYQANETFLVGAGTGLLFYDDGLLIPLFIDLRLRLAQNYLAPYLSGAAGMLLNPSQFDSGTRMFINPSAGIMYSITRNLAANVGAGLQIQMAPNIGRASFVTARVGIIYKL